MQELQNELNRGFEAQMMVLKNELILIRSDMQRVANELATAEDIYSKAFNKVAQHLSTHPLCAYEELRQQAREEFEKTKQAFFADLDGYEPFLQESSQKIEQIVDEVNTMIKEGYDNNARIEEVLALSVQAKNYIHNGTQAIKRTKMMIEKNTI